MKKILGLDLGTNSIGWALVEQDFEEKKGKINGLGSRIIPMDQGVLSNFGAGQSHSQTAERTDYRGKRRLIQRHLLRRERLHRVLNKLNFLPEHYADAIDFEKHFGQFKKGKEVKLNYFPDENGNHKFLFMDSFGEMIAGFKESQPQLFYTKSNGREAKIPLDWTIYYLRKKALSQKISKEELSWLLLNFNQKRGYYQLGEDEDVSKHEDTSKKEDFHALKVIKVEDSGDKNNKGTWYSVYLENGLIYRRQSKEPLDNWINKSKEFIVTTTIEKDGNLKKDKEGNIKRSFRAVDSEKDWIAIKKKTEQDINTYIKNNPDKTVGCYIYDTLLENPAQKLNGKFIKTIERKYYKEELAKILEKQIEFHPELKDAELCKACIEELYPRNEAHQAVLRDKDITHLFIDDIIFYHRPLKSKKSTISGCQYECRTYQKENDDGSLETIKEPLKVISKSHPLFKEFRLWQFLHNLKIYKVEGKNDNDITRQCIHNEEEWCDLFDFLNDKKEAEQKDIISYFIKLKKLDKAEKENYRWNYVADKKYPMNETRSQFLSRLKQIEGINAEDFLTKERELHLWHIVYSVKGKRHADEFEKALGTFAGKHEIDKDVFAEKFKKCPPFESSYGAYSEKAIKKLLPLMRTGRYWNENDIAPEVKERINSIVERIEHLQVEASASKKKEEENLKKAIDLVADDAVPKQLIKSFLHFKGKNPLAGLSTYQACYAVYERHSEVGVIQQWKTPADIDTFLNEFKQHSLRNPIVEQVVLETLRTVRDIWTHYGNSEEGFFDEIHLELGRDMKNSAENRKKISEQQAKNENTNQRIKALLEELKNETGEDIRPYSPSHQEILKVYEEGVYQHVQTKKDDKELKEIDEIRKKASPTKDEIQKYKLWLEQGYISPYTGQAIPLSKLFSSDYQIEHIIPLSRYFDDSLNNKVICESVVNEEKSNQTAFEFIKSRDGKAIDLGGGKSVRLFTPENYESHCNQYFKKNRTKLNNLLSEEVPEGFIKRQMNDSRYISKYVKTLLSNIVREEGEKEATAKNLVPVSGTITSKLKQDWGLNDKWNELIAPRFKRLNELTRSQDFGYWDTKINAFRIQVPKELEKGFDKKRIDHRHHALDALVIASCTKDHINYITSIETERTNHALVSKLRHQKEITTKNKNGEHVKSTVAKAYKLPWSTFPVDAKTMLENTVISFKQNLRVINKTNNKTWQWVEKEGKLKKELVKQEKGDNWAIRKPLHKETIFGEVKVKRIKEGANIEKFLNKPELIVNKEIKEKVKRLCERFDKDVRKIKNHLKQNPLSANGEKVSKIQVFEWTQNAAASRTPLSDKFTAKQLESVTDSGIKTILKNHVKNYIDEKGKEQFDLAFGPDGVEELNKNIVELNNGKKHQPIYKVRLYEEGNKFSVGENGEKGHKHVEAAKGTNLFFAIYWDEEKKKRAFETIPLYEVIAHQKQRAALPKEERKATPLIPVKPEKGRFLFSLSPQDLVYMPTDEEIENPHLVDFNNLTKGQVNRIYKMVSCTGIKCHFLKGSVSQLIKKYDAKSKMGEFGSENKSETSIDDITIKDFCWKLEVDRLGHITKIIRQPLL